MRQAAKVQNQLVLGDLVPYRNHDEPITRLTHIGSIMFLSCQDGTILPIMVTDISIQPLLDSRPRRDVADGISPASPASSLFYKMTMAGSFTI